MWGFLERADVKEMAGGITDGTELGRRIVRLPEVEEGFAEKVLHPATRIQDDDRSH